MNKKFNGVSDKVLRKRHKIAIEILDTSKELPNYYLLNPESFKEYVEKLRKQASIDMEEISKEMQDRMQNRRGREKELAQYRKEYSRERRYKIAIGDWSKEETTKRTGSKSPSLSSVMEEHEVVEIRNKEQQEAENERLLREWEEKISKGENPF